MMKKFRVVISNSQIDCVPDSKVAEWHSDLLLGNYTYTKRVYVANVVQFNELRVGVRLGEIAPFTVDFYGVELTCNDKGVMSQWPEGFFDEMKDQMNILHKGK